MACSGFSTHLYISEEKFKFDKTDVFEDELDSPDSQLSGVHDLGPVGLYSLDEFETVELQDCSDRMYRILMYEAKDMLREALTREMEDEGHHLFEFALKIIAWMFQNDASAAYICCRFVKKRYHEGGLNAQMT